MERALWAPRMERPLWAPGGGSVGSWNGAGSGADSVGSRNGAGSLEWAQPPSEKPVLECQLPVPTSWVDPPACVPAQESQGMLQLRQPPLWTLRTRRPPLGALQLRQPQLEAHQPP